MSGPDLDRLPMEAQLEEILTNYSLDTVLPLPDGVLSFTYRLVLKLVKDCQTKYQQGLVTSEYLEDLDKNIKLLLQQAEERSQSGELASFKQLAHSVLRIIECITRSLEHLETAEGDTKESEKLQNVALGPDASQPGLNSDLIEETIMQENTEANKTPEIHESASSSTDSLQGRNPCKRDYSTSKLISNGAYGAVYLVHHKDTNKILAMKKVDKQNLSVCKRLERIFLERDILTFIECPFVASMFCSFPSKHHLCMVMEYVGGGDCGSLLKKSCRLPVTLARLYFAETVLAVEYLHSYGIVHRDLKPDNLLITPTGHIKVTDFGLSKLGLMRPKTNIYKAPAEEITKEFLDREVCGTPNYTAPEVILQQGYGRPIDWWSMGIILYEFLVGTVPFGGRIRGNIYFEIINNEITWDFENTIPPPEAQNIIMELLRKNPERRLGTGGADEIKSHPFLRDLDFENILSQEPEYVPQLVSDMDTRQFDTRSGKYHHVVSSIDEEYTSEDNNCPKFTNFVSSCQRLERLYSTIPRTNEDPKSPAECSTEHCEKIPCSEEKKMSIEREEKEQKTEQPDGERTSGSAIGRLLSSCRRGVSRATRAIGESCFFSCCCFYTNTDT